MPAYYQDYANNRTSLLVPSQLPEFIQFNYQNFTAFLTLYYEYMEQSGKLTNISKNIPNYLNIDYVVENNFPDFIEQFRKEYLVSIPKNALVDKALLLKHIKEFYTTKGTEKSYKFLFRILFNEDVDIFTTGNQVLRVSDGKWYQPSVVRISTANNLSDFVNLQVIGQKSFATGVVEDATVNFQNNFKYNELTLTNITKNFLSNEILTANTSDGRTLYGTILSVVAGINVVNQGSKYNVGDPVIVTGGGGANASAIVSEVSPGSLLAIGVVDGGAGFQSSPNFNVNVMGSTSPVSVVIARVDTSGTVHPNSYILNDDLIGNNYNSVLSTNISIVMANTQHFVTYSNTGPVAVIQVVDGGKNFIGSPTINITQNTKIGRSNASIVDYGIIGTFKIINGGINYAVDDDVKFTNISSRGAGAGAKVSSVDANGVILTINVDAPSIDGQVRVSNGSSIVIGSNTFFTRDLIANNNPTYPASGTYISIGGTRKRIATISNNTVLTVDSNFTTTANNKALRLVGFTPGGFGYKQSDFPNGITLKVLSANGTGAIVTPDAILGAGTVLQPVGGVYGQINQIDMIGFGDSFTSTPSVDLTHSGDGTATATAVFLGGIFQYPGRFLNEDGFISSRRYIQDSVVYNSYSYLIKSKVATSAYYDLVYNILNPAGSNMIGYTNIQPIVIGRQATIVGRTTLKLPNFLLDLNFVLNYDTLS